MCLQVFVASAEPLEIVDYNPFAPVFRTQSPQAGSEPVRRLFSKHNVYDLDSVDGCACGFGYGPYDLEVLSDPDVPAEVKENEQADYEARRESVRLLREYLRAATRMGTVEVYSCWIGDEEAEPETRLEVTLDHFGGDSFAFVQRQLLTVSQTSED